MFFVVRMEKIIAVFLIIASIFLCYGIYKYIPTIATPITNRIIVIDAGHGGFDPGAVGKDGTLEKDVNLKIALKVQDLIQKTGGMTVITRAEDESLAGNKRNDMIKRKEIRNEEKADIFISIHLNSFPQENCEGAQVFYPKDENSKRLAEKIQNKMKEIADPENTRVAKLISDMYILKNAEAPSAIVECGFLSNSEEEKKLNTDEYQSKLAWGIYLGIMEYFEE